MYRLYFGVLRCHYGYRPFKRAVYCADFYTSGDRDVCHCKRRIFPVFHKLHIRRDQYFCFLHVYGVFRWKNLRDHFFCPHLCTSCVEYSASPCCSGSNRHLACCSDSRIFHRIFISFLFLEKKKCLPLCARKKLPSFLKEAFFLPYSDGMQFTDRLKNL